MVKYLLLAGAIITAVVAQFFLKYGVVHSTLEATPQGIIRTLFVPQVFFGLVLYGLSAMVWLFVLKQLPLSVAYPSLALSYVFIVLIGVLFFGEVFSINKFIGLVLIMGGVSILFI